MKKLLSYLFTLALILGLFAGIPNAPVLAVGTNYYIDTAGNNGSAGTSPETAWADFTNVSSRNLSTGDQILLKRGCTWYAPDSGWYFCAINGSGVTVDAYGTGANPALVGDEDIGQCFYFLNRDNLTFQNLSIYNGAVIVANSYTTYNHSGLTFRNIYLNNGKLGIGNVAPDTTGGTLISDVVIDGLKSENATGPYFGCIGINTSLPGDTTYPMAADTSVQDVIIHNVELLSNRKGLMSLTNCSNVTLSSVRLYNSSTDYAPAGTTAIFLWKTSNLNFINCMVTNTANTGSYDQCAIDNEAFINASIYKGCYFGGNAGAGLEFLNFDFEGDYNHNHVVDSCTFQNNALAGSGTYKSGMLAIDPSANFTGTSTNNIYRESTGFTTGDFSHWTTSNNTSISSDVNISNSGWLYSGTQGASNWSYQSYNGSSWSNLSYDSTYGYYGTSSNFIGRFETLPDATSTHMTAKTYTAPYSGIVNIRGWAYLPYNNLGGDGVRVKITKNGTTQWGTQTISGTNTTGYTTNISDMEVNAGDVIRFEVDCGSSSNNSYDNVSWMPTIAYVSGGNLLPNPGFESGTTSWSGYNCTIASSGTAHSGSYGCLSTNRYSTASSPYQDIRSLLNTYGQGTYKFGAWARLASGSDGALVVICINDSTGNHWFTAANYTTIGTSYTPLSSSSNITWTGTLNSAMIYIQTQTTSGDFYADDYSLCKTGNLLSNPGFESGTTASWTGSNCTIAASGTAHSGSYGCYVTNRYSTASAPFQDIKGILTNFGKGNYRFSAWGRQASGTDGMLVVICVNDSNGNHWYACDSYVSTGTAYTQFVVSSANITWTGTLNSAYIYVQNQTSTANIYADDFSLIFS
ncbi:MAG: carbohydrate binding domain-containing protein [Saccharofermentanales bacterium]